MNTLTQTFEQITEGFNATDESQILPIYYGNELANRAAFTAFRIKRFAEAAGRFTAEAAHNTAHAAVRAAELTGQYLTYMANN